MNGNASVSLAWAKLLETRQEISIAELGLRLDMPVQSLALLGETPFALENCRFWDWFKVGSQQFIKARRVGAAFIFQGFSWSVSDGAFARALTGDLYFDDGISQIPPADLLPDGKNYDYQSVAELGKKLGTVHFHDYVGCQSVREVAYDRFTFYYRDELPRLHEPPFCIKIIPFRKPDNQ